MSAVLVALVVAAGWIVAAYVIGWNTVLLLRTRRAEAERFELKVQLGAAQYGRAVWRTRAHAGLRQVARLQRIVASQPSEYTSVSWATHEDRTPLVDAPEGAIARLSAKPGAP